MNHPPIVLHGNNFDSNRGCQALRLTTQMILDRYLPDYPRLYANIFRNDDPQFTHRRAGREIGGTSMGSPPARFADLLSLGRRGRLFAPSRAASRR